MNISNRIQAVQHHITTHQEAYRFTAVTLVSLGALALVTTALAHTACRLPSRALRISGSCLILSGGALILASRTPAPAPIAPEEPAPSQEEDRVLEEGGGFHRIEASAPEQQQVVIPMRVLQALWAEMLRLRQQQAMQASYNMSVVPFRQAPRLVHTQESRMRALFDMLVRAGNVTLSGVGEYAPIVGNQALSLVQQAGQQTNQLARTYGPPTLQALGNGSVRAGQLAYAGAQQVYRYTPIVAGRIYRGVQVGGPVVLYGAQNTLTAVRDTSVEIYQQGRIWGPIAWDNIQYVSRRTVEIAGEGYNWVAYLYNGAVRAAMVPVRMLQTVYDGGG